MPPFGKSLAAGRIGLGIATMIAPELAGKSFGLNVAANPESGTWARLFATREIMLGSAVLFGGPGAKGFGIKAGIGVDAGDALGAVLEHKAGRLPKSKAGFLAAVALGAVGAGIMALSE